LQTSFDKRQGLNQSRGTSNNNNSQQSMQKVTLNALQSMNAAFSPDKRQNVSRSQQNQINMYFKRGAKT